MASCLTSRLSGQDAPTPAPSSPASDIAIPAARKTAFGFNAERGGLMDSVRMHPVVAGHLVVRPDSVRSVVEGRARTWIPTLEQTPVTPLYQIPMASLAGFIGDDAKAQHFIDAHLATSGLTVNERIATLRTALADIFLRNDTVQTLASLAIGERYLAQLDRIPLDQVGESRFMGRMVLMGATYRRNDVVAARKWGWAAYGLIGQIPDYESRAEAASSVGLLDFAQLLANEPGGERRIDSLRTALRQFIVPPAKLVATDTIYRTMGQYFAHKFADVEAQLALVGKPNTAIMATHWYNQPLPTMPSDAAPGARLKPLNDGIIRIVGFGWFDCPHCKNAMGKMQRLQTKLPKGVEFLYVERTQGVWGGEEATPDAEAEHLRHAFLDVQHYTFPIAIWAGPRDSTPEGWRVVREFPMLHPYRLEAGPSWLVVDGQGVVRGTYGGEDAIKAEWKMWRLMQFLVDERAQHNRAASDNLGAQAETPAEASHPSAAIAR